ncbi:MAG: hypothetical protein KDJ38_19795, partial [Gammaproteobacteria bacterium]|nr:hypothetical protein [Gammaproteobacteria bacterium]
MKIPVLKNNGLTRLLLLLLVSVLSLGTALGQDVSPGTVTFNSQSYRFAEDDGRVTVELQRSGGSAGAITVKLEARSVSERATAVQGRDYRLDSDSVSWRSGESGTKSFGLTMLQDDDGQEGDEAFDLLITDLGGAGAGKITRTRIVIADSPPIVRNAGEVNFEKANWEIREDGDFINIAVLRSGGSDGVAEVGYSLGGNQDTATPGEDYTRVSGTLRWQDGEDGPKTFSVKVLQDQDGNEGRETVGLFLTKPVGATTGNTPSATLTIIDVPPATGLVEFAQSSYQFSESDGEAVLILKRVNGDAGVAEAFIGYGGSGDSAIEGEDYTEGTTRVRWADGDSADKRITVPLKTDSLVEEDESFSVFLDDVAGADFGQRSSSTVTIKDSTVLPRPGVISFRNATHTSAENAGDIKFDVLRRDGSDGAVSVAYRIGASGDTATADADYKSGSGTLRWADGDSSAKQITLSLLADQQREADEFVSIVLSSPEGGATLGDPDSARITIQDASSAGTLSFSSGSYTVNESDGSLSIGIRRSGGSAGQVSVKVRSGADDDSASSGADYEPLEQTLSWAEGDTGEKSVTLTVREDTLVEGDEFLTLSLLDVSGGAQLSDPRSASVKIVNTTPVKNGTLGIEQASYTVAEAAGTLQVRVLRASGTDGAVSVNYSLGASGDTALAGEDYV